MNRQRKWLVLALATTTGPALAQPLPIQPLDVPGIQSQYNSVIQQQSFGTQLNDLRLQQNLNQDRIRELDLFRPLQPYGATTIFQPQPPGLTPLPQNNVIQPRTPVPPPPAE